MRSSWSHGIELERKRQYNLQNDGFVVLVYYLIFYFVARIQLLIPSEIAYKSNISFRFYFFYIIHNKKVMIKRILYFNICSPQDG